MTIQNGFRRTFVVIETSIFVSLEAKYSDFLQKC